ncbi:hypothetical protein ZIOFF_048786 [Zingiber officinale]|uniref:Uncharacterized protein n=1 Tax=Zingiber officinale TaxID=94328 RepID=A0A8J5FQ74_ZINOF|nr:hypothetical protein ZIOFF_048786 [Zingiber officinale]
MYPGKQTTRVSLEAQPEVDESVSRKLRHSQASVSLFACSACLAVRSTGHSAYPTSLLGRPLRSPSQHLRSLGRPPSVHSVGLTTRTISLFCCSPGRPPARPGLPSVRADFAALTLCSLNHSVVRKPAPAGSLRLSAQNPDDSIRVFLSSPQPPVLGGDCGFTVVSWETDDPSKPRSTAGGGRICFKETASFAGLGQPLRLFGLSRCSLDRPFCLPDLAARSVPSFAQSASSLARSSALGTLEVSKAEGRVTQTTNVVIGGTVVNDSTDEWLVLDKKVNSYPMVRHFTAIGIGGDEFVQAMVDAVESVIQESIPKGRVTRKVSSRGKYVSVNIGPIHVVSSEQVQAVYNAMKSDDRMKYFL